MDTRNTGRIKKYGICLNNKCKDYKVVKEILHGNMECECGKKLSPCPPPKEKNKKLPLYGGVAVAGIAAVVGCVFLFFGSDKSENMVTEGIPQPEVVVTTEPTETVAKEDTLMTIEVQEVVEEVPAQQEQVVEEPQQEVVTEKEAKQLIPVVDGKYQLSYGFYTGDIKDGYPHGQGRLTYIVERQINKYDMKKRTAKAGQYVIGEFQRGFFIQGRLYAADGELLESIMIGTAPGNAYEKL